MPEVIAVDPTPLRAALTETGAIGATARQLAARLERPAGQVEAALEALRARGDVLRLGRGLWVLRSFEHLEARGDFVEPAEFEERFRAEQGVALGRYRGPITFRSNDEAPVHRWWPYVQGYSAEFVRGILTAAGLSRGATVLDPFAGSGTTLVEARRAGARPWGTELLRPAVLAARVKCRFELDPDRLGRRAAALLRRAAGRRGGALPFLRETVRQFDASTLAELVRLRDALPPEGEPVADALRLAFGAVLIPASRLHRSPCLGYARRDPRPGPPVAERFAAQVAMMRSDLAELKESAPRWGPPATVRSEDARCAAWPAGSVDLAVTSPPYVNGLDYVMNYKLDLAWLGYARSYADLSAVRRAEVACDNLPRAETAAYVGLERTPDPWLDEILPKIRENVARKGSYRRADMHGVVHRYFVDLAAAMDRVYRALRPGGRCVLVVGDSLLAGAYVPGDLITARLGRRLGFAIESVDVARSRRSGQRRSFELRETVVSLVRPRTR